MERNENEWNISNLVWEQYEANRMKSFQIGRAHV